MVPNSTARVMLGGYLMNIGRSRSSLRTHDGRHERSELDGLFLSRGLILSQPYGVPSDGTSLGGDVGEPRTIEKLSEVFFA